MSNKKSKKSIEKEPIKVRKKTLPSGNKSLYLDIYYKGRRRYEFLNRYLVPETTQANKIANKETLQYANTIKAQRTIELYNDENGLLNKGKLPKANLIKYVTNFAEKKKEKAGGNERGTYLTYIALIHHLTQYSGDKATFKEIDKHYCIGFLHYLKTAKNKRTGGLISENSRSTYIKAFTAVLNSAVMDEMINANPFNHVKTEDKPKRNKKEIIYLYPDEINILSKTPCPNIMVKNAFLYACFTGLRFGDIEALTWGKLQTDGNGDTMLPYIQKKTGKQEYLPICSDAMLFLPDKTGKSSDDLIFTLPNNGYTNIILKEWILSAGITKKITFHVARHTTATLLLSNNVPIEIISKILGHSDIKTTQDFYAAVMDKNKRAAVNTLNGIIN